MGFARRLPTRCYIILRLSLQDDSAPGRTVAPFAGITTASARSCSRGKKHVKHVLNFAPADKNSPPPSAPSLQCSNTLHMKGRLTAAYSRLTFAELKASLRMFKAMFYETAFARREHANVRPRVKLLPLEFIAEFLNDVKCFLQNYFSKPSALLQSETKIRSDSCKRRPSPANSRRTKLILRQICSFCDFASVIRNGLRHRFLPWDVG